MCCKVSFRAVLIRRPLKLNSLHAFINGRFRAVLIRRPLKRFSPNVMNMVCFRAVLIRRPLKLKIVQVDQRTGF